MEAGVLWNANRVAFGKNALYAFRFPFVVRYLIAFPDSGDGNTCCDGKAI
jgi:hypothetical protein